jgi:sterol desaturase/sphingolipid hydroxylase (fatty acid hydroxylase superfamily)
VTELIEIVTASYVGYYHYLIHILIHPFREGGNFFYLLLAVSLLVWMLEILSPWRKKQSILRRGFWLDAFYMFFNFFLFNLIVLAALSATTAKIFEEMMAAMGLQQRFFFDLSHLPQGSQILVYFLLYDFVQWLVHNLLHRVFWLWKFHQTHHSVKEMGFAAHFRFHFMEIIFYRTFLFILLGWSFHFKLEYAFYIHTFTIVVGHLNHANLNWDYGILKYVLNNPKMHIWHHAKTWPRNRTRGMNFGLTLSIWDYLFGTAYVPYDGKDLDLGFEGDERFPSGFIGQQIRPFIKIKKKE